MLKFLLTLAVCTAGGILLKQLKVPGGMMVGALLAAMLLNVATDWAYMPYIGRFAAQAAAGAYIGAQFDRAQLQNARKLWKPYLLVMVFFLLADLLAGFLIWRTGACDLMTGLLSCVPGGMSDTPLIAADMGADVGVVAILQFVRMITGVAVMPSVIALVTRDLPPMEAHRPQPDVRAGGEKKKTLPLAAVTMAVALAGGFAGKKAGIPAGTLVGALVAVMAMNLGTGQAYLPMPIKRVAQILSGAYIGCTMARETLFQLKELILPAGIILAVYIPISTLCGWIIAKALHWDVREAMLCASPGGAADIALIAADLGVTSADLMVVQVTRMVTVVLLFPQIILRLCLMLGQGG